MSRKQRRAAGSPGPHGAPAPARNGSGSWGVDRLLEGALRLHGAGRLAEAENAYRTILASDPEHVQSLHHLGVVAAQVGRHDVAIDLIGKSLALNDRSHEAHHNIGLAHHLQGNQDAALAHFLRAIKLKPSYVDAHVSLANLHKKQGEADKAVAHYRRALGLQADHAEANYNFGVMLEAQGKWDEAATRYRRALTVKPGHAQAHANLGNVLLKRNEPADAILCYRRSLELKPDDSLALRNLATALHARGEIGPAMDAVAHALLIDETDEAKELFVRCASRFPPTANFGRLRSVTIRAFSDCWGNPAMLAALSISLIKQTSGTSECIARAKSAWPNRLTAADLFGPSGLAGICGDDLLRTLLESTQIPDVGMERFLTAARSVMLDLAASASLSTGVAEPVLGFQCSLARQCFINEYVFDLADDEADRAQRLRQALIAALASGDPVPPTWVAAVASYFPLHSLPAPQALLDRSWPEAVSALLDLQVREPMEERDIAPTIPRLTEIDDDVSLLVQRQYEQNPYPRWIKLAPAPQPVTPDVWLRRRFGTVSLPELAGRSSFEMLIAGCGTGRHSIESVRQLAQTRALAVDLSSTSLCYAKRRTRALGISNIEYAQADILKLGSIGRTFDIIESVGVLHHLADPMAGWRVLLSLLRPGGLMFLGFYSELARREVVAARAFIAERGYGRDAADIRRCRQDLLASGDGAFRSLLTFTDFYSVSDCRDLLFHVQEQRLTLPQINAFLAQNNLKLIGFQVDAEVRKKFQLRFPGDAAVTDLEAWHVFETENPDTFAGMYQFWIQKSGEA
jgi:tetratricopeptide (TPR) repeat protein/SAM-dependent methyltransferase